ncbi:MAG: PD-(D/E)XK nuclease family protein [Crocinitomicaceae bacterium]|nr:PD-(D/E)XK nuclease family protein [Crocinitomicaceae bacterium]
MKSFLEEQVEVIFDRHKHEIDEISIIIPNRRAATYIQKYLAKQFKKPFFSPEILTINEWVNKHTEEKILSTTELLFILYGVHCQIESKPESFEQFVQWGRTMLTDFDEIDKYMIAPSSIFRNLKEIKKIENWSFDTDELSKGQEHFKTLWDKLDTYYSQLEIALKNQHATYSGKAYQQFYQKLLQLPLNKQHYFLGFNAVSRVERQIMYTLQKEGKATVVFDVDKFYYSNNQHEAGHFYREIVKEWDIKPNYSRFFEDSKKHFEIIETSQQIAQTKIAGHLIDEMIKNGKELSKTAIVLADESLLIPLSRSLPPEIKEVNITMGWPIKFSHLKGFMNLVFELQFNFNQFKHERIYHKSISSLFQHPYISEILGDPKIRLGIIERMHEHNLIFMTLEELVEQDQKIADLKPILTTWEDKNVERLNRIHQIADLLYEHFKTRDDRSLDLEILYQFSKGLKKFEDIIHKYDVELTLKGFKQLFFQFWQNETVSFLGNPIDGLQVMGILETRTLDFENLIILGMNEGNLPKSNFNQSFIPRDLRLFENQLPTEEDRQAIFAHHFYRLLHRATNIFMTYNSNAEGLGSGERSRFIIQLENELDTSKGHSLTSYTYSGNDDESIISETVYHSTSEVHQRLDALLERGLSPSALNKLIQCPLDFYYRYILRFDEGSDVEESIESSTFGTKIHQVLQDIIEDNFKDGDHFSALKVDVLKSEKRKVKERLEAAYLSGENSKKFSKNELKYGQNKLSFDVSVRFIEAFLDEQIKELSNNTDAVIPLELEHEIMAELKMNASGSEKTLRIKGNADRIDKIGGTYRILDYKSGKCDKEKVQLKKDIISKDGWADFMNDSKKSYARQLLMYALMFRKTFPDRKPFLAGIISMVNMKSWVQSVQSAEIDELLSDAVLDKFEEELKNKIAELYDPGFEFKHDPEAKYCEHCHS